MPRGQNFEICITPKSNMVTKVTAAPWPGLSLRRGRDCGFFLLFSVSLSEVREIRHHEWGRSTWPKSVQRLAFLPASSQGAGDKGRWVLLQQFRDPLNGREIPDYRSEGSCRSGVKTQKSPAGKTPLWGVRQEPRTGKGRQTGRKWAGTNPFLQVSGFVSLPQAFLQSWTSGGVQDHEQGTRWGSAPMKKKFA